MEPEEFANIPRVSTLQELQIDNCKKFKGLWGVGYDTMGIPTEIPFIIIQGENPGPTLWIQGCIDGDEPSAAWTVISLARRVDPKELSGRLILIPVLSVDTFRARSQISLVDGLRLRSSFPGDPNNFRTMQIADAINKEFLKVADYLIDIHSGTSIMFVTEFASFCEGLMASEKSEELALATGSPIVVKASIRSEQDRSMMFINACESGIPAIMITKGGHRRIEPKFFEPLIEQCTNAMRYLGMIPGEAVPIDRSKLLTGIFYSYCTRGGFIFYEVGPGDWLVKDQVVARIYDVFGNEVEIVKCPHKRAILLETATGVLNSGELIAEYFIPIE